MISQAPKITISDELDRELDRLIDQPGYSPRATAELLDGGITRVYELIHAKVLDAYWDGGRKITGLSIKRHLKQQIQATADQPLRRGGPGRRKTVVSS